MQSNAKQRRSKTEQSKAGEIDPLDSTLKSFIVRGERTMNNHTHPILQAHAYSVAMAGE